MRVLVVRTGGLGDALLTLPVIARIETRTGKGATVLGNSTMRQVALLRNSGAICHDIDEPRFLGLTGGVNISAELRLFLTAFDAIVCFSAGNRDAIRNRVAEAGVPSCVVLDPRPPHGYSRHITTHLLSILDDLFPDKPNSTDTVDYGLPRSIPSCDPVSLIIHPGSGGVWKQWPLERFIAIAERVHVPVRFVVGPAEVERGRADRLAAMPFPVVTPGSIGELVAVLSANGCYLGNDSGASHLAAALGLPSVVLFGPSDPVIWRPLGDQVRVLTSADGSTEGLTVEEVSRAVGEMLTGHV